MRSLFYKVMSIRDSPSPSHKDTQQRPQVLAVQCEGCLVGWEQGCKGKQKSQNELWACGA